MSTPAEGRYALLVASARYTDPKLRQLRAPAADANRLAAVLGDKAKGNFEVDVLVDERHDTVTRRIATFFRDRRPDDLLLLHFSCHGVKDDRGELYLAATDTEMDLLSATGVSAAWLNDQITRTRSRRTVVLLDCCFSGSFPFGMRARAGDEVNAPEQFEGRGRAIITASSGLEYAYEGDELRGEGQPSVFTEAVVEGLETGKADLDHDQRISVDDLYGYVYDRVKEKTPSQTPNKKSEIEGPLYLAASAYRPPVEPATLDPDLLARTEDRYAGIRMGAVHELAELLDATDPGVALAARQALSKMVNDDSRQVSTSAQAALAETAPVETAPVETAPVETTPVETTPVETTPVEAKPVKTEPSGGRRRGRIALAAAGLISAIVVVAVLAAGGGNGGNPPSEFRGSGAGAAIDDSGHLWVSDPGNHQVVAYDSRGRRAARVDIGTNGTPGTPRGLARDPDGNILVADSRNREVVALSAPQNGLPLPAGVSPRALAVLKTKKGELILWLADPDHQRVMRIPTKAGEAPECMSLKPFDARPGGLAVSRRGRLWIADMAHRRVIWLARNDSNFPSFVAKEVPIGVPGRGVAIVQTTDTAGTAVVTTATKTVHLVDFQEPPPLHPNDPTDVRLNGIRVDQRSVPFPPSGGVAVSASGNVRVANSAGRSSPVSTDIGSNGRPQQPRDLGKVPAGQC